MIGTIFSLSYAHSIKKEREKEEERERKKVLKNILFIYGISI